MFVQVIFGVPHRLSQADVLSRRNTKVVGSLRDLAEFHRASPISTWAGQNLDVQVTRPLRYKDCKSNDTRSHLGIESLV